MENNIVGKLPEHEEELLFRRFPEIGFALAWTPGLRPVASPEEILSEDNPSDDVEVVYVYGIGNGEWYCKLLPWLSGGSGRLLVFFEYDLGVLSAFFMSEIGKECLRNPRVEIVLLEKPLASDGIFDEFLRKNFADRVEFFVLPSYAKGRERTMKRLRLSLFRKAALMSAAVTEVLHYHRLTENIAANCLRIPEAFHVNTRKGALKGIPAVICGAGASLAEAKTMLEELENRAVIVAGGSGITALHALGIKPHIAIALDPNEEEYFRVREGHCFEIPFLYSSRLHKEVLSSTNVLPGYLYSETGGAFEDYLQEIPGLGGESLGPELGAEALSVTTLALPVLRYLGCDPIFLSGVDLSYSGLLRYAEGVDRESFVVEEEMKEEKRSMQRWIRRNNREGKPVHTLVKWVLEASCLGAYAKSRPETRFFHGSNRGLPISGIPFLSIADFTSTYCTEERDLRGLLHREFLEKLGEKISREGMQKKYRGLAESLSSCLPILQEMIQEAEKRLSAPSSARSIRESAKIGLLEEDLQDLSGYRIYLQTARVLYEKITQRYYPSSEDPDSLEHRRQETYRFKRVTEQLLETALACLAVITPYSEGNENA